MIPVVYWSGTGNTEKMAEAVALSITSAGGEAQVIPVGEADVNEVAKYDTIILGCPAMGAEQLEEGEFEPFMQELEAQLNGKKVALFGSFGWGGSYMEDWKARCEAAGATLVCEPVLAQDAPDDDAIQACKELGEACSKA